MTRHQAAIESTSWLQRPRGSLSAAGQRSHGGRAATLVITALAILMMVML